MSLNQDKALINNIIPYFHDKDFNQRFESMTSKLSKSSRFLIKMEVNRLQTDCNRSIDLRGRVSGTCQEYKYQNLTHYLDDVAIGVFEEAISVYTKYTTGVFEEVTSPKNSYREQQDQQDQHRRNNVQDHAITKQTAENEEPDSQEVPPNHAKIVNIVDFNPRSEERVNILTKIIVRLANGKSMVASTTNLSVHGAKIKLSALSGITNGQTLYVH
ncbi:MAG: hypothetical protein HRU25_14810, partial [Psychrobium sp.]|nr:hypothetical protein [Psychrobium sp.]